MFRMYIQKPAPTPTIIPAYQPPVPNISIKPLASAVVFGSVFAPLYSTGPCTSCGNSK